MEKIGKYNDRFDGEKRLLLLLVLMAFIIRIGTVGYFKTFDFPTEKGRVGAEMGWIAHNLASGEGFKSGGYFTAWMAPVYPYILMIVYRVFEYGSPTSTITILVLQSFTSALILVPLYLVGRRLFSWQVGLTAAILWVFYPASIQTATYSIWSANLTALGLIFIVALFLKLHESPNSMTLALGLGVLIGLTALTEPAILLTIPFLAFWLIWRTDLNRIPIIWRIVAVTFMAILVILPWTMRNVFVFKQVVLIKGNLGVNLWLGNYNASVNQPTAGLSFPAKLETEYDEPYLRHLYSLNEIELDEIMLKRAIGFIIANPDIFLKYSLHRVYLFWRLTTAEHAGIMLLDRALLLVPVMTLLGIVLSRRYFKDTSLLLLVFVSYPLIYYVTHADLARYRFPIESLMILFVAFLIHTSFMYIYRRVGIRAIWLA